MYVALVLLGRNNLDIEVYPGVPCPPWTAHLEWLSNEREILPFCAAFLSDLLPLPGRFQICIEEGLTRKEDLIC